MRVLFFLIIRFVPRAPTVCVDLDKYTCKHYVLYCFNKQNKKVMNLTHEVN